MNEMMERVARALWADVDDRDFDALGPLAQKRMRDRARVVFAAMREPTEAMVDAGQEEVLCGVESAEIIYRAMIDAALE